MGRLSSYAGSVGKKQLVLAAAISAIAGGFAGACAQADGAGIVPPAFATRGQTDLYERMSSRLVAPCCWGEAVRLHQSPAAAKVRAELIAYLRAGMGEREIQDRFAREYGERILGQPRGIRTVVAYSVPAVCCAMALAMLATFLLNRRRKFRFGAAGPSGVLPDLPDFD